MPKPQNIIPSRQLNVALPLDIHTRLSAHLYSELEGRVPHGSYSSFFVERIKEFFTHKRIDLAPYAGTPPGLFIVTGSPETVEVLLKALKGEVPV